MKANIKPSPKQAVPKKAYEKTLTVGMIVKNEEQVLRRCLESIAKLRDKIDVEVIVTDTGSTDGSVAIANELADIVTHFEWCDDFGKARNVAMDMARGEWFMYIDADEWLSDELIEDLSRFFISGEYKKYLCGRLCLRNYTDFKLTKYDDLYEPRITSMDMGQRFTQPIHETLVSKEPFAYIKGVVHHTGYVFTSSMNLNSKRERNNVLIEKYLEKSPNDLAMWLSYYSSAHENKKQEIIDKLLSLRTAVASYVDYNNILIKSLKHLFEHGQQVRAIEIIDESEQNNYRNTRCLDIFYFAAMIFTQAKNFERALHYGKLYLQDLNEYQKNPAQKKYNLITCASQEHQTELIFCMLYSCAMQGRKDEFMSFCEEFDYCEIDYTLFLSKMWGFFSSINFEYAYFALYSKLLTAVKNDGKNIQVALEALSSILINDLNNTHLLAAMQKYFENDELTLFYNYFSDMSNQKAAELLRSHIENNKTNFPAYLLFWNMLNNMPAAIDKINSLPQEVICRYAAIIASYANVHKLFPVIKGMPRSTIGLVSFCYYLNTKLFGVAVQTNQIDKYEAAHATIKDYYTFTKMLYNDKLFTTDNLKMLPEANRFVIKIVNAEGSRPKEYLDALRDAVTTCPTMKELAEVLLDEFQESLSASPVPQPNSEFMQLAEQIKKSIPPLIAAGQLSEALEVLQKLKALVPSDKEVDELIFECKQL